MIVVDTTVLADLLVGESQNQRAANQLLLFDPVWISVGLVRYELGNVLWKYARLPNAESKRLENLLTTADAFLAEVIDTIDPPAIWGISMESGLTYYDSAYVWLARERSLTLYTRDIGILKACPGLSCQTFEAQ